MFLAGTSGYEYWWWFTKAWTNKSKNWPTQLFYPPEVTTKKALSYYSAQLPLVELNGTFYKLPSKQTVLNWKKQGNDLRFLPKFSRFATHAKKLADFPRYFSEFWDDRLDQLGDNCLGILIQLGPKFIHSQRTSPVDGLTMLERIQAAGEYLKSRTDLPNNFRVHVEFRHPSWFCQEVYAVLETLAWSIVCVNMNNSSKNFGTMPSGYSPSLETLPKQQRVMFRCHGTWDAACHGGYDIEQLLEMYTWAREYAAEALFIFDNTDSLDGQIEGAPPNALRMEVVETGITLPHAVLNAKQMWEIINSLQNI